MYNIFLGVKLNLFVRTICVFVLVFLVAGCERSVDPTTKVMSPIPGQVLVEPKGTKVEVAKTSDGIKILANKPEAGDLFQGITIQTKDLSKSFDWNTSSNPAYYPVAEVGDFYTGNKDELVVILTKGHGTGVLRQEIHVLNVEDLSEIPVDSPEEAIKREVKSKLTKRDQIVTVELETKGAIITKEYTKSEAGSWSEGVGFGDIVRFEIIRGKITANLPGAVSPGPLIVATAVVSYGKDLKVDSVELLEEFNKQ